MSEADTADLQALARDTARFLTESGAGQSSMLGALPPPGLSPEERQCWSYQQRIQSRMVEVNGEITGPGGLRHPLRVSYLQSVGGTAPRLEDGLFVYISTGTRDGGPLNLTIGARYEGESHISGATVAPGSFFTRQLGSGFAFRGTVTEREPTPAEQARNTDMAERMLASARERQNVPTCEGEAGPGGIIYVSPFTNAVIREGDPRAAGTAAP